VSGYCTGGAWPLRTVAVILFRELLNRRSPDQEVAEIGTASDMVTKLRSAGILITHDGQPDFTSRSRIFDVSPGSTSLRS
jgi:hypothetical protein